MIGIHCQLLEPRERRQFFWLIGLTVLMRLFVMLGVASILPFLAGRTVRACDVIFLMEAGRVGASGSYAALLEQSPAFRALRLVAG